MTALKSKQQKNTRVSAKDVTATDPTLQPGESLSFSIVYHHVIWVNYNDLTATEPWNYGW